MHFDCTADRWIGSLVEVAFHVLRGESLPSMSLNTLSGKHKATTARDRTKSAFNRNN